MHSRGYACLTLAALICWVAPQVDLAVVEFDYPESQIYFGDNVSYDVVVLNAGAATATGIVLTVVAPSQFSPLSQSQPSGCTVAGQIVTCRFDHLASGQSLSRHLLLVAVDDGTAVSNVASVSAAQVDYNAANNTHTGYSSIRSRADLGISLTPSMTNLAVGQPMSYSIAVTNYGPWVARQATVVMSRNGLTVDSNSVGPSCPQFTDATVTCSFTNIGPGATAYATVNGVIAWHGTFSNTAAVTTDALDANTSNNGTSSASTSASALGCPTGSSRPKVVLAVTAIGNQTLHVVVSADTVSQPSNRLEGLFFGSPVNAAIDVPGGPTNQTAPFNRWYVDRAVSHEFNIRRTAPGSYVTVPLTVRDNCGDWQTFVGGGPSAFP